MDTNSENLWNGKEDLLNRKKEAEFLLSYLTKRYESNQDKPFVLNINAEWGFGKTFFLENLATDLKKDYPVLYFDAWKNDYTKDPLLAFISEMDSLLTPYFSKDEKIKGFFKKVIDSSKSLLLPIIVKKLTGHGLDELEKKIEDNNPEDMKQGTTQKNSNEQVDENKELKNDISSVISKAATLALAEHRTIKDSITNFKTNMNHLVKAIEESEDINLPMFIFIDELDRCRPNYAIELLENIKHIFDIPGIIFVVATDSKQLSHSINAIYGNNFESERYLKRFFDQEYALVNPNSYLFAEYLFKIHNILDNKLLFSPLLKEHYVDKNLNAQLFSLFSDYFKLSYRDQEQIATSLSSIILLWDNECHIHSGYLLFLLIIKQKKDSLFQEYMDLHISGKKKFDQGLSTKINLDSTVNFNYYTNRRENNTTTLSSLIYTYLQYIDVDLTNLKVKTSNSFENKITERIRNDFPNGFSGRVVTKYNFDIYPSLVLRTGQFS